MLLDRSASRESDGMFLNEFQIMKEVSGVSHMHVSMLTLCNNRLYMSVHARELCIASYIHTYIHTIRYSYRFVHSSLSKVYQIHLKFFWTKIRERSFSMPKQARRWLIFCHTRRVSTMPMFLSMHVYGGYMSACAVCVYDL